MEFEEHLALIHPRWLRGLLSEPETLPKTAAFYVSGSSGRAVVLSVLPGMLSVTEYTWDSSPMEGQFIRARRESIPLSAVEDVALDQSIGNVTAHGGHPEHFDASATITLAADLGVLGKEITLPLDDDDYGHNPEQRPRVLRSFITTIESSIQ